MLAAKEKGESKDSPFFFIYKVSDLEFKLQLLSVIIFHLR